MLFRSHGRAPCRAYLGQRITMKIDKEFYPKIVDHPLSSTAVYPAPLVFGIRSAFPMLPRPSKLLLAVSYGDQARVIMPAKTSNDAAWLAWHLYVFSKNHQGPHTDWFDNETLMWIWSRRERGHHTQPDTCSGHSFCI